jgi:hypothetical protein
MPELWSYEVYPDYQIRIIPVPDPTATRIRSDKFTKKNINFFQQIRYSQRFESIYKESKNLKIVTLGTKLSENMGGIRFP